MNFIYQEEGKGEKRKREKEKEKIEEGEGNREKERIRRRKRRRERMGRKGRKANMVTASGENTRTDPPVRTPETAE